MRLSPTDLAAPVLAIIAGGAIGGLLTLSPLVLWAPSDPVVAPSATAEALRLEEQRAVARAAYLFGELAAARSGIRASSVRRENRLDGTVVTGGRIEVDPVEISPDGQQWIARQSPVYVDGVRVYNDAGVSASVLNDLNPQDIESIEVVKAAAAVALYGEEASGGVIQITLKEDRPQR